MNYLVLWLLIAYIPFFYWIITEVIEQQRAKKRHK
jgi:hypothetical protein